MCCVCSARKMSTSQFSARSSEISTNRLVEPPPPKKKVDAAPKSRDRAGDANSPTQTLTASPPGPTAEPPPESKAWLIFCMYSEHISVTYMRNGNHEDVRKPLKYSKA